MSYLLDDVNVSEVYRFNEGSFELPYLVTADKTVNVLTLGDGSASLSISRGELEQNQTLEEYFQSEVSQIQGSMQGFKVHEIKSTIIGSAPDQQPALEANCELHIDEQGQKIDLYQRLILSKSSGNRIFIVTYGHIQPLTSEDEARWEEIKASFKPSKD